jgi:hypothetical protein
MHLSHFHKKREETLGDGDQRRKNIKGVSPYTSFSHFGQVNTWEGEK